MTSKLASRAEQADGPDPLLDAEIACLVLAPKDSFVEQSPINGAWVIKTPKTYGPGNRLFERWPRAIHHNRAFTASLDAITALIAEKLPGWQRLVRDDEQRGAYAHVMHPDYPRNEGAHGEAYANTPALALCAAFLKALEASK